MGYSVLMPCMRTLAGLLARGERCEVLKYDMKCTPSVCQVDPVTSCPTVMYLMLVS